MPKRCCGRESGRLGQGIGLLCLMVLFTAGPREAAHASWQIDCAKDIRQAMVNLTVAWKHLNSKRRLIGDGRQYVFSLQDSGRCLAIWKARIEASRRDGTFVWWSRSAVRICEAGERMSTDNLARVRDRQSIAFWRRRLWRYQHCVDAGQRIVLGMGDE